MTTTATTKANFLTKHKDLLLSTLSLITSMCFFVFFILKTVHAPNVSLSIKEQLDAFTSGNEEKIFEAILNLISLVFSQGITIEALFQTALMRLVFSALNTVFGVIVVLLGIVSFFTYMGGLIGKKNWSDVSTSLIQSTTYFFAIIFWYFIVSFSLFKNEHLPLQLTIYGICTIIAVILYVILKNFIIHMTEESKLIKKEHNTRLLLSILFAIYDLLKLTTCFLVFYFLLKEPIMRKAYDFMLNLIFSLVAAISAGEVTGAQEATSATFLVLLQTKVLPCLKFALAYVACKVLAKSVFKNIELTESDNVSHSKTKIALIIIIIAIILDMIASWFFIAVPIAGIVAWWVIGGKYLVLVLLFLILACLIYSFKFVIYKINFNAIKKHAQAIKARTVTVGVSIGEEQTDIDDESKPKTDETLTANENTDNQE